MELQPGDACQECLSQGLDHKLRYFYINLEEQLLKCESRSCLWPHNDEISSDEEEAEAQSVQADDDDFIMQLLTQLGPSEEQVATEASAATEQFSMPDILAEDALNDLAATCENILSIEPHPAAASAKISASASPSKLLSNLNACDKPLSTPAATTTTTTVENAISLSEEPTASPSINYIISLPDLGQQLEPEKHSMPATIPTKPQPFQLAPRKASIHSPKLQLPSPVEKPQPKPAEKAPPKPADMPAPSSTTAMFLDALRRQPVRPVRSPLIRQPRRTRTPAGVNVAAAPAVPSIGLPPTQLVMQFLSRIGTQAKAEGETEVKKEAP